jgi:hypothetical protein
MKGKSYGPVIRVLKNIFGRLGIPQTLVMSWDRVRNREREQSLATSAQSLLSFY